MFNTTYRNGRTADLQSGPVELAASRSDDVRFINNLAWSRPGVPALQINKASEIVSGGNVFITDTPTGAETELDLVTLSDPRLMRPDIDPTLADFRPLAGSIVIDRGVAIEPLVVVDADGRPRSLAALDVGAYEAGRLVLWVDGLVMGELPFYVNVPAASDGSRTHPAER